MPNILKIEVGLRGLISTLISIGNGSLCRGLVTGSGSPV